MSTCPECKTHFVQPFVCTTCGAQKLYDETLATLRAEVAELHGQLKRSSECHAKEQAMRLEAERKLADLLQPALDAGFSGYGEETGTYTIPVPAFQDRISRMALNTERNALERAAMVCDAQALEPECPERAQYCASAIRALMKEGGE